MYRFIFFAKCFYVYTAMKMPRPSLSEIAGEKYGYVQRIAEIVLRVVGMNY